MSDEPKNDVAPDEEAQDVEELADELLEEDGEVEAEGPPDLSVLTPGPDAVAEPYHAIMLMDGDGNNTGQLWTFDGKIMLFESLNAAKQVHTALSATEQPWVLRGVSAAHLKGLRHVAQRANIPLFVVVGFTPKGKVEAMPLETHDRMAAVAGTPPPLPPAGSARSDEGDSDAQ